LKYAILKGGMKNAKNQSMEKNHGGPCHWEYGHAGKLFSPCGTEGKGDRLSCGQLDGSFRKDGKDL
jgi:hypothetical protein